MARSQFREWQKARKEALEYAERAHRRQMIGNAVTSFFQSLPGNRPLQVATAGGLFFTGQAIKSAIKNRKDRKPLDAVLSDLGDFGVNLAVGGGMAAYLANSDGGVSIQYDIPDVESPGGGGAAGGAATWFPPFIPPPVSPPPEPPPPPIDPPTETPHPYHPPPRHTPGDEYVPEDVVTPDHDGRGSGDGIPPAHHPRRKRGPPDKTPEHDPSLVPRVPGAFDEGRDDTPRINLRGVATGVGAAGAAAGAAHLAPRVARASWRTAQAAARSLQGAGRGLGVAGRALASRGVAANPLAGFQAKVARQFQKDSMGPPS